MKEIVNIRELRLRYLNGNRKTKDEILKSLEILHGYHRKSAIRLLRQNFNRALSGKPPKVAKQRGAKSKYQDPRFVQALRKVWKELDFMSSRNLKKAIPEWLPFYEKENGIFLDEIRNKLLSISGSSIDRILRPYKHLGRGRCGTKPGSMLRSEIPISTTCWDIAEPGYLEGDTVAHCGGYLNGRFVWSLTATDICTTWTEVRAVWHKGTKEIISAIEDIHTTLPFAVRAWDSDNGAEFINRDLIKYFGHRSIRFTRSRPYHKNDNSHVEQKNYTHVRQLLGYGRIDNQQIVAPLQEILRLWSLLKNHFYPTSKLISKFHFGGKTRKIFDKPKTPYERVLLHSSINQDTKIQLQGTHRALNPVKLKKQIHCNLRLLDKHFSVSANYIRNLHDFGNT